METLTKDMVIKALHALNAVLSPNTASALILTTSGRMQLEMAEAYLDSLASKMQS